MSHLTPLIRLQVLLGLNLPDPPGNASRYDLAVVHPGAAAPLYLGPMRRAPGGRWEQAVPLARGCAVAMARPS